MSRVNAQKKMKRKASKQVAVTPNPSSRKLKSIAWLMGNEDWTKGPVYKQAAKVVRNVAKGGPLNVFGSAAGKRRKLLSMDNEISTPSSGLVSNLGSSQSVVGPHITHIGERMERVGSVVGTIAFTNSGFSINPGLPSVFPWLSTIANAYELYTFRKLWFEYRTTSGEVVSGTNPAIGKVIFATNYDPDAPDYVGTREVEDSEGNSNFPPYQAVARHFVDVNGKNMGQVLPYKRRYTRSGPVPVTTNSGGSGDPHAYDVGRFQCSTEGMPANGNPVGELWVGYSIDLIKPRYSENNPGLARYSARWNFTQDGADHITGLSVAETYPSSNIPLLALTYSTTQGLPIWRLPAGSYVITCIQTNNAGVPTGSFGWGFGGGLTIASAVSGFRVPNPVILGAGTAAMTSVHIQFAPPDSTNQAGFTLDIAKIAAHSALGTLDITIEPASLPYVLFQPRGVFSKNPLQTQIESLQSKLSKLIVEDEKKDSFIIVQDDHRQSCLVKP